MDRIEQLAKQLNETRASKRIAAVRELAKIGGERVVPHLIGRLSDAGKSGDVRVCDIAAEGLEKIGSPEALVAALHWREDPFPFFEKALKSYDPFLEIAAVREISKMDGQRVIDALLYATASYSYRVSRAARGIIEGKGTEAVSYLVNYLNGKNNFRRGYAAVLLGRIGDEFKSHGHKLRLFPTGHRRVGHLPC
jgi:HEAT repeat protein